MENNINETLMRNLQTDLVKIKAKRDELKEKEQKLRVEISDNAATIHELTYLIVKLEDEMDDEITSDKKAKLVEILTQLKRNGELNNSNVPDLITFLEQKLGKI